MDQTNKSTTNADSADKTGPTNGHDNIDKMGVDRLNDSALAQRRAAASTAAKANLTSDDYVTKGPVDVKSAVPASIGSESGGGGNSPSTNSTSTIIASGRSPAANSGSGFRESRRGSVPIVPGRK